MRSAFGARGTNNFLQYPQSRVETRADLATSNKIPGITTEQNEMNWRMKRNYVTLSTAGAVELKPTGSRIITLTTLNQATGMAMEKEDQTWIELAH